MMVETVSSASQTSIQPGLGFRIYRLLQWLIIVAAAIGLIWGWQFLRDPVRFPVRTVKVEAGYQHVDKQTLAQIVMPYVERGFFGLKVRSLKQHIAQLPWVAQASVVRVWPDKIIIQIQEQQAVAQFGNAALINEQGQLFRPPVNTFPANLPVLNGNEDKTTKLWQYYQEMNAVLMPLQLSIRELDLNNRQSVNLVLSNGTVVLLGHNQILSRLQRFVKVYPQIFTSTNAHAERVDLRYENGLTIKWASNNTNTTVSSIKGVAIPK